MKKILAKSNIEYYECLDVLGNKHVYAFDLNMAVSSTFIYITQYTRDISGVLPQPVTIMGMIACFEGSVFHGVFEVASELKPANQYLDRIIELVKQHEGAYYLNFLKDIEPYCTFTETSWAGTDESIKKLMISGAKIELSIIELMRDKATTLGMIFHKLGLLRSYNIYLEKGFLSSADIRKTLLRTAEYKTINVCPNLRFSSTPESLSLQ